ncbi:MAG: YbaN family protein [Bacteroidales bacterium]|nr:YbaN family protein [Bacteroidales bacterium]MDD4217646.1 YbaN family protein [Bacteroidales bacterium]MDY0142551.1 YbaN family protein [Bacteroidales bacterium]
MIKIIYIVLGSLSVLLGIIGIVVPGLPTTPFMLLAAWFYIRSNDKLYNKLINNKFLGKYISQYQKNKAIPLATKIYSILIMWLMIALSVILFITSIPAKIVVVVTGIIGTIVMGFVIKTLKK